MATSRARIVAIVLLGGIFLPWQLAVAFAGNIAPAPVMASCHHHESSSLPQAPSRPPANSLCCMIGHHSAIMPGSFAPQQQLSGSHGQVVKTYALAVAEMLVTSRPIADSSPPGLCPLRI